MSTIPQEQGQSQTYIHRTPEFILPKERNSSLYQVCFTKGGKIPKQKLWDDLECMQFKVLDIPTIQAAFTSKKTYEFKVVREVSQARGNHSWVFGVDM